MGGIGGICTGFTILTEFGLQAASRGKAPYQEGEGQ